MSDAANLAEAAIRRAAQAPAIEAATHVFRVLHGMYGNLFLARHTSGVVGQDGADEGVKAAQKVWAYGMRDFDAGTVKAGLAACMERHPDYPPTLPQFLALCKAARPREASKGVHPLAIGMGQQLRSEYARRAREIIAKHDRRALERRIGLRDLPPGIAGLKEAIADAVACAGGDEAAEMLRLDRLFGRTA